DLEKLDKRQKREIEALEEQRVRHREQRDFEFRVREQLKQQIRALGGEPAPL
ncbi:unnamed protein product, partial [Symbiodinium pilosum]